MKNIPFVADRVTPRTPTLWLVLFIGLMCVSLVLGTLWQIEQAARERLDSARASVLNIASAVEQHALDTVSQASNALRDIAERVEVDGLGPEQRSRLGEIMTRYVVDVEGLQGLFIYDEQGNWVANSFTQRTTSKNNSDREYFIYHRDHPNISVHIGSIIISRTTGDMIIPVSRRLHSADGRFAGVVLATIPVAYFQGFYGRLSIDDNGVIFMALNNGDFLARRPIVENLMKANIANGEIFSKYLTHADNGVAVIKSILDGVERIYAYRRVAGLPLVVAAGQSTESVYAQWWDYVYRSVVITGLMITALVLMGVLVWRQIQQVLVTQRKLAAAHRELEQLARTDGLTGIANRRSFDLALEREWLNVESNRSRLAIILLDIDWFKQYNDHYGHPRGDDCLKRVARLVRDNLYRPTDMVARYGGEEFVVLLPNTGLIEATFVAERIRLAIADDAIKHASSPLGHVTASAGVASTEDFSAPDAAAFVARVDSLLYAAKKQGRNRVCHQLTADLGAIIEPART